MHHSHSSTWIRHKYLENSGLNTNDTRGDQSDTWQASRCVQLPEIPVAQSIPANSRHPENFPVFKSREENYDESALPVLLAGFSVWRPSFYLQRRRSQCVPKAPRLISTTSTSILNSSRTRSQTSRSIDRSDLRFDGKNAPFETRESYLRRCDSSISIDTLSRLRSQSPLGNIHVTYLHHHCWIARLYHHC